MSIFNPCLVLFDYGTPERKEERAPQKARRRLSQWQVEIPRDTAMRFFKLETERRPLK